MSGLKFGIDGDTRGSAFGKFLPPVKNADGTFTFPIGYLVNVEATQVEREEDKKMVNVLYFTFRDKTNKIQYRHTEWEVEPTEDKAEVKMERLNGRIKHLFETYAEVPEKGIGAGAKDFKGYFSAIEKQFNTTGDDKKPIYTKTDSVWILMTYYNGRLGFPLFPNFIEKTNKDNKPKILNVDKYINLEDDTRKKKKANDGDSAYFSAEEAGDFPDFPE